MQLMLFLSVCSIEGCGEVFQPHPNRVYPMCTAHASAERVRVHREQHREEIAQRRRELYAINCERERMRQKAWRAANKDYLSAKQYAWSRSPAGKRAQAKYHKRNKARRLAANKAWRAANRERRRVVWKVYHAARQARKSEAPGCCSKDQWLARWNYFGGRCWMCSADADSIDHVIPLARGGTNWPSNLRPACRRCNSAKGARSWRLYTKEAA